MTVGCCIGMYISIYTFQALCFIGKAPQRRDHIYLGLFMFRGSYYFFLLNTTWHLCVQSVDIQSAMVSTVVLTATYRVHGALRLRAPTVTTSTYWTHPSGYDATSILAGITGAI
jgi:hypothetical protein